MKYILTIFVFFLALQSLAVAQPQFGNGDRQHALRVFVDCRTHACDLDYFRTEITFVDWVRDQGDADVHVLVTSRTTGSGGSEFTLQFMGLEEFEGVDDELLTTSAQTDTDDEVRNRLASILKVGFMRYVGRTPWFDEISISRRGQQRRQQVSTQPEDDPWNFWVFRTRFSGSLNGEDRYQTLSLSGSVTASRTTEDWKTIISSNLSRRSQDFTFDDGSGFTDIQENYGFDATVVKSLNNHWSAGALAEADRSTRSNLDLAVEVSPAIEYNFYPYSESTRKQATIRYAMGVNHYSYSDSTIFNKIDETLLQQYLAMAIRFNQPWGEFNTSIEGANFMSDFEKFSLELTADIDIRIFRGLSFNVGGMVSFVRDQINIAKGDESNEDVLLRRRELETDWRYFTRFGINYTFGSIFNNVVNPRFSRGYRRGGGFFF